MDTPTIAKYYREKDPMERLKLLEQSIAAGEEPEENRIRKELWEIRYSDKAETGDTRADGYLGLWMTMEFNRNSASRFFGTRSAKKEIGKYLKKLKFQELQERGGLYEELLYRECCHMVKTYMELCEKDKTYNTTLCGIVPISEKSAKSKLQKDVYTTAIVFPEEINMQEELEMITRAAREAYEAHFPGEGGLQR